MSQDGSKIRMDNGKLQVPNDPIIPFIEGDGIGPDIWKASVRVFDAAVEKAYHGERKINWLRECIVFPISRRGEIQNTAASHNRIINSNTRFHSIVHNSRRIKVV